MLGSKILVLGLSVWCGLNAAIEWYLVEPQHVNICEGKSKETESLPPPIPKYSML